MLTWLVASFSFVGITLPRWVWIVAVIVLHLEWFLGWSKNVKANSILGGIAKLLGAILARVPGIGPLFALLGRTVPPEKAPLELPPKTFPAVPPAGGGK